MLKTIIYNLKIAGEAIIQNKLRAILTSLGIICGVASVITMLAIGKGAEQEILEKMKLLGTNNIIIEAVLPTKETKAEEENSSNGTQREAQTKRFSPGLSLYDAESILTIVPHIENVSSEIVLETIAYRNSFRRNIKLIGIDNSYFDVNDFDVVDGSNFTDVHYSNSESVCIIGSDVAMRLFPAESPIGKYIKCGEQWLKVIGTTSSKTISNENIRDLGIRDYNLDVYIPITTMLLRFENRWLVTQRDLQRRGNEETEVRSYHQIDKIVVRVNNTSIMDETAEIIDRMLFRRHNLEKDYKVIIPEALLEQEKSAKRIFNIVLGAIASISLIVGGIGIMNIMLASVLERTKEIGIRKAVGAKRIDIMLQFLSEAIAISFSGGIIGIILGISGSFIINFVTDIHTIVTPFSIIISFFVSISVGLIFGITPARRAALQDPIDLLRYE